MESSRRIMLAGRGLAASLVSAPVRAQAPQRRRRIALLRGDSESNAANAMTLFIARRAELGWSQGQNLEIVTACVEPYPARARAFVESLARAAEVVA